MGDQIQVTKGSKTRHRYQIEKKGCRQERQETQMEGRHRGPPSLRKDPLQVPQGEEGRCQEGSRCCQDPSCPSQVKSLRLSLTSRQITLDFDLNGHHAVFLLA